MADALTLIVTPPTAEVVHEDQRERAAVAKLETRRHAQIAKRLIEAEAPRDTGRLAGSIEARQRRVVGRYATGFEILGGARRDGFSYQDVTRFGHRAAIITPKRGRFLNVHFAGRNHPPVRRRFVRGYHPTRDWVEVGVNRAERAITRLG